MELFFSFDEMPGRFEISERGEEEENGWTSECLVNRKVEDDMNLSLGLIDEDGISLTMDAFHIEDEETKRAFHAVLKTTLRWNDVKILRDCLNVLLEMKQDLCLPRPQHARDRGKPAPAGQGAAAEMTNNPHINDHEAQASGEGA